MDTQDMMRETIVHGTYFEEYLNYHFKEKTDAQRREYLTDSVRNDLCKRINDEEKQALLLNKYRAYLHFKEFYGREALLAGSGEDKTAFLDFAGRHGEAVAKPIDQCAGRGITHLCFSDKESWSRWYDEEVAAKGMPMVIEECIQQDEGMGAWHPSSVNTIRANTILKDGQFSLFSAFMRTGRNNSFMDNCGQGGLLAAIDTDTGIVLTDGCNEKSERYPSHPDSLKRFQGAQIPQWDELKVFAEKLARHIHELTFVAWDLALTPKGWVMVEGNKGQFMVQQICLGRGIRKDFEQAAL